MPATVTDVSWCCSAGSGKQLCLLIQIKSAQIDRRYAAMDIIINAVVEVLTVYRDIVVCISETEGRDNIIRAAARFANEHNARLTGLYLLTDLSPPIAPFGAIPPDIAHSARERQEEWLEAAEQSFTEITQALDCDADWLAVPEREEPLKVITYSDLIITNQVAFDPQLGNSNASLINHFLLDTAKPLIVIPGDWTEPVFGSRVLVGWDESRQAVRAVQDAMPILKIADQVDIVSIDFDQAGVTADVSEITTYLTRRNISCNFYLKATDDDYDTPEKVLLHVADNRASDLVVVGGYGHSRLREIVLGGVTRYMTHHCDIPVLLSH